MIMYLVLFLISAIVCYQFCDWSISATPILDVANGSRDVREALEENIFHLPKKFRVGDVVNITGKLMKTTQRLTVNLVTSNTHWPDFNNIACQVRLDFPYGTSELNRVTINSVVNGTYGTPKDEGVLATEWFPDQHLVITFKIEAANKIGLVLRESDTLHACELEHNLEDIMYLTVGGDISRIESFHYAMAGE